MQNTILTHRGSFSKQDIDNSVGSSGTSFNREVKTTVSEGVRAKRSYCDVFAGPIRKLFWVPVEAAKVAQEYILPNIMLTVGYPVLRKNFGFSRDKIIKNILLGSVATCMISRFWVNPWFYEKNLAMYEIWNQVDNMTISDSDYSDQYYSTLYEFSLSLLSYFGLNLIKSLVMYFLRSAISFKEQHEFVLESLSNFSIYGVSTSIESSGTKLNEKQSNLSTLELFHDIENQNKIFDLWESRISSVINFITAGYRVFTDSPYISVPLYFFSIMVPMIPVLSLGYSLIFNGILTMFEWPMRRLHEQIVQIKDLLIRLITQIEVNAELISFHNGENYEAKKLLDLLDLKRKQDIKYELINIIKSFFENYVSMINSHFIEYACLDIVRNGSIKRAEVGMLSMNFYSISSFFTWSKTVFENLKEIEESNGRLKLYQEGREAWKVKCKEISEKKIDSDIVAFNGKIYGDKNHKRILAMGQFILPQGAIVHFNAPSGCGKTTLFRIFRGLWNEVDGNWSLPQKESIFLPSQVYVLGAEEPLFQTVCYPAKFNAEKDGSKVDLVKKLFKLLQLDDYIYEDLIKIPVNENKDTNTLQVAKWSTSLSVGERKRVAFCNVLLKLKTEKIKFLIMDEPFSGLGYPIQLEMVKLIKDAIGYNSPSSGCTVLYSSHELNHGLNTHILEIDADSNFTLK